jgi:hypothetical protein
VARKRRKKKMPEKTEKIHNRAQISFESKEGAQFWIRAFQLEADVQEVTQTVLEKKVARATVPIIAEYQIGSDLKAIYLISLRIDSLGLVDGIGVIYFASPENEKDAYRERDRLAKDLLEEMRASNKLQEVRVIPEGKEK